MNKDGRTRQRPAEKERTDEMTAIASIDEVARGMFSFQIKAKWARLDNLLRVALGIPLPREVGLKQSALAASRVSILKVALKLFGVDETGQWKTEGEFNEKGFRKTFYNEFQRLMHGSRSTIGRGISDLKKAGILDAFQEVNEDGSMGAWWIRINPWALLEWLEELSNKTRSKKASPCLNNEQPLSSSKQEAEVAVAIPMAEAVKKGIISPGGDDSNSSEQTPGFSEFAKAEILKSETGKVLPELVKAIPEFEKATPKQLKKLHELVHHFVPALRCSLDMVKALTETMAYNPEFLENFSKIGVADPDAELGVVDTFLKFWPGISRKLWAMRLSGHDQNCYDDRYALDGLRESLFAPANKAEIDRERKLDSGSYWVRCLALALTHKWTAAVVAVIAQQARGYLMRRPIVYATIRDRFPEIIRLCNIPERCHKKLMAEALTVKTRLNVWSEVQETYGFEYIPTPFQRMREMGYTIPTFKMEDALRQRRGD